MIISAIISTKRIERFLSQVEISKEFEGIRNMARVLCKSNTSLDEEPSTTPPQSTSNLPYEESSNNNQIKSNEITIPEQLNDKKSLSQDYIINGHDMDKNCPNQDNSCSISKNNGVEKLDSNYCSINDSSFTTNTNSTATSDCDDKVILRNKNNNIKLKKQNQLSESTKLERNLGRTIIVGKHCSSINSNNNNNTTTTTNINTNESLKRKLPSFKVSEDYIVSIKDAKYSWDDRMDDSNMLKIDQLSIPRGTINIILMQNGS